MSDWRPIESAPKNGWFWLWLDWRGACVGRRSKDPGYQWEFIEHKKPNGEHPKQPTYRLNAVNKSASHWMPLPQPPAESEKA